MSCDEWEECISFKSTVDRTYMHISTDDERCHVDRLLFEAVEEQITFQ